MSVSEKLAKMMRGRNIEYDVSVPEWLLKIEDVMPQLVAVVAAADSIVKTREWSNSYRMHIPDYITLREALAALDEALS